MQCEPTLKQQKLVSEDEVETVNTNQSTIEPKTTSFSTQTDMTESRSAGKHWIDPTLHEHEYARPCISGSRDTGTQTRRSETEDKGVNCSTLHIRLTSADISPDSLFLLYTGLPLKTFRTVLSVMQNMTHLHLPCLFQIKFCWLL